MAVDSLARAMAAGKIPVTAYEEAVAGGYTGTKEQFEEDMGNSATNATNAADSADAAAASATTASNAAANFAPAYSSSAIYAVGDHVLYDGGYYVCNTAITTAEAWTAAHWTAAKVGPEITDLKTQIYEFPTLNTSDIRNAYPSRTIGQEISYTSSSATKTIVNIIPVVSGQEYTVNITNGNTLAHPNDRNAIIVDANNIVRQDTLITPVAGKTTATKITSPVDGYLVLAVDANYVSVSITINKIDAISETVSEHEQEINKASDLLDKFSEDYYGPSDRVSASRAVENYKFTQIGQQAATPDSNYRIVFFEVSDELYYIHIGENEFGAFSTDDTLKDTFGIGYTNYDGVVERPENATWFVLSKIKTTTTTKLATIEAKINSTDENVTELHRILELENPINIAYNRDGTGAIKWVDGSVDASPTTTYYTDYIDVSLFRHIFYKRIKYAIPSVGSGMAFYDEQKQYVSGVANIAGADTRDYEANDYDAIVPNTAKYARFTYLIDTETHGEFEIKGGSKVSGIGNDGAEICWTNAVKPPYWVFLLDTARKYFTIENIKTLVDEIAEAGFNQMMFHMSNDYNFRFALNDMEFTVNGNTYDLSQCLGGLESPNSYYDEDDMDEIIAYCHSKSIDFVPLFEMPGHMGKILSVFTQFLYPGTTIMLNIKDTDAVNFAKAIADRYSKYFASRGCRYYNIGYDELPNISGGGIDGGFKYLYDNGEYNYVTDFGNDIADLLKKNGLIPRTFNEPVYLFDDYKYQFSLDFEVMHWTNDANQGYATAQALQNHNYKLINTSYNLYWILDKPAQSTTVSYINSVNLLRNFRNETVLHNAFGATLCAWCDGANTTSDAGDGGDYVVEAVTPLIAAFGNAIDRAM